MSDIDNFGKVSPFLRTEIENILPMVEVTEQPATRVRFRYICEQRQSFIRGFDSMFPKIRINDPYGLNTIIVISCVTKDKPYRVHPHGLSGSGTRDGFLVGRPTAFNQFELINIGIQRTKLNQIDQALLMRAQTKLRILSSELQIDPFGHGFSHSKYIRREDMYALRLAFQVFVQNRQRIWEALTPAVSEPIYDIIAPSNSLQIRWLSDSSGSFAGDETVVIELDEKVEESTEVVFYEASGAGEWKWQSRATILMVHHNTLVFKTPLYERTSDEIVNVFFVVRRLSDNLCSIPRSFQYSISHQGAPPQMMQPSQESRNLQLQALASGMPLEEEAESSEALSDELVEFSMYPSRQKSIKKMLRDLIRLITCFKEKKSEELDVAVSKS